MSLPITLVTACTAALILIWLSVRVIRSRISGDVLIGDGGSEDLVFAIRSQGNFTEYAPLFLIVLGLVEGFGGNKTALMAVAGLFLVARVLHVLGMGREANLTFRQLGMVGTFLSIAGISLYGLYLGAT